MKFTVQRLRIGDLVWAQIVEIIDANEFIVSFQGDLIRIRNETQTILKFNEKILVKVVAVQPLAFQLRSAADKKSGATRINISI